MYFKENLFYQIAITPFSLNNQKFQFDNFLKWILWVKKKNGNGILIREWNWTNPEKLQALEIIAQNNLLPILHSPELENPYKFYHWNSKIAQKPNINGVHGVSCHNLTDIYNAQNNGFDYVFLSPIYPTHSHKEAKPLGINYLKNCVNECKIPIIALGGIYQEKQIQEIQNSGAKGFASIRYFEFCGFL